MMMIDATSALWFLPVVAPICFYVAWSDMRSMRIPNIAVLTLFAAFVVVGFLALPIIDYPWRFVHLAVVLLAGIALNAAGLVGAGDAKFAAAAAPFIHPGDARLLIALFAATLLAAWLTHRLARHSPIRRALPDWKSWYLKSDFPMGLALGGTLASYLALGVAYGC